MKIPRKLVVAAAVASLGMVGLVGTASATTGYSADCADVNVAWTFGNQIAYHVTNRCVVGVSMNALTSGGDQTGCNVYDPGETETFGTWGHSNFPQVEDVVYC